MLPSFLIPATMSLVKESSPDGPLHEAFSSPSRYSMIEEPFHTPSRRCQLPSAGGCGYEHEKLCEPSDISIPEVLRYHEAPEPHWLITAPPDDVLIHADAERPFACMVSAASTFELPPNDSDFPNLPNVHDAPEMEPFTPWVERSWAVEPEPSSNGQ